MESPTSRVQRALTDLRAGRPVVLTGSTIGDADGYLLLSAETASPSSLAFLVRHSAGFVCAAVTSRECTRLGLTPMAGTVADPAGGYYTVSVDAVDGVGTGISASDRARTLRQLADPASTNTQFTRPGHVVPRRAHDQGVLTFRGPAESITDLNRAAGLRRVGVYSALVSPSEPTRMVNTDECRAFAVAHDLNWVSAADIALYRRTVELHVRTTFTSTCVGPFGDLLTSGFHSEVSGTDFVAYRVGRPNVADAPAVHVHRESNYAPHASEPDFALHAILERVVAHGDGVVLVERCASNPDRVPRTPEQQAAADDARNADIAQILKELGVTAPVLLDPNDSLVTMLELAGIQATSMPVRHEHGFATADLALVDAHDAEQFFGGVRAGR